MTNQTDYSQGEVNPAVLLKLALLLKELHLKMKNRGYTVTNGTVAKLKEQKHQKTHCSF